MVSVNVTENFRSDGTVCICILYGFCDKLEYQMWLIIIFHGKSESATLVECIWFSRKKIHYKWENPNLDWLCKYIYMSAHTDSLNTQRHKTFLMFYHTLLLRQALALQMSVIATALVRSKGRKLKPSHPLSLLKTDRPPVLCPVPNATHPFCRGHTSLISGAIFPPSTFCH